MGYIPFSTAKSVQKEFEKCLQGYSVIQYTHDMVTVYLLDDSLAILFELVETTVNHDISYAIHIAELTPNLIGFRFSSTKFARDMLQSTEIAYLSPCIHYVRFNSESTYWWSFDKESVCDRVDALMPELRLLERIQAWQGDLYHFIVLELEGRDGTIARAVAYSVEKPHTYIIKLCNEWIKCGKIKSNAINNGICERNINACFNSWKGMRRQERLEKHFTYFSIEHYCKDLADVYGHQTEILNFANDGEFSSEERSTYLKPINKWVSEELVYNIIKKIYEGYHVIYQHRPFFLRNPGGGQMSYDVFISELNVAIEYQGKQHFEPVEYFGGREHYEKQVQRDKLKLELSQKNGVCVVYINYWEDITVESVKAKIEQALKEFHV
jgi:hypothetical protein